MERDRSIDIASTGRASPICPAGAAAVDRPQPGLLIWVDDCVQHTRTGARVYDGAKPPSAVAGERP
jgi:hypothetical protein